MTVKRAPLSVFTDDGLASFRLMLQQFKDGLNGDIPDELLTHPQYSQPISRSMQVELQHFEFKIDAARYLAPLIAKVDYPKKYYAPELWGWLSAFYFESVCPIEAGGLRAMRETVRYVQVAGQPRGSERHLLAFPVRLYSQFGENAPQILIGQRLTQVGEAVIQFSVQQSLLTNPSFLSAADILYWDFDEGSMKRGAAPNSKVPGTIRRLVDVVQQLEVNFDLYAMSPEQILDLLPSEFDRWKPVPEITK